MQQSKPWKHLFWVVPVIALVSLIVWRVMQKRAEAAGDAKAVAARKNAALNVDAVPVTRRTIITSLGAVGSIEAPATVQVSPRVSGQLLTLLVREGDRVKVGQELARIDPQQTQAQVRQAEAALAGARSRLAEAKVTQGAQNVGVYTDIEKNQAALATAQAQNRQARADFAAAVATAEAAVTAAAERVAAANATIRSADADINSAKASVANAKLLYERQNTLLQKGFISAQQVDNAKTELAVQQAELASAEEQKKNAVATRDAAVATQKSAEKQVTIARNKANADVAVANATLGQSRATLRASQANTSQTQAYQENLAALSAAVAAAQADLQAARVQLNNLTLRSTLDGIVTARLLEPGAVVSATTPIVSVQSIRRVWATVSVPEETARLLAPGQQAAVTLDALPGEKYTGRILQVLPAADPQSRQFTVRVALDNSNYRLRPGTFARVSFVTKQAKNVLTVPPEAIKTEEKDGETKSYVMTVGTDNKAQKHYVTTGLSDAKYVSVSGDVQEGDKVIVLSQRDVREGQMVRAGGERSKGNAGAGSGDTGTKENAK